VSPQSSNQSTRWQDAYPFCSHYLNVDDHRLHYLDEGQGRPLLMVHGNPTWSFYWRKLIHHFRDTHRVIVPDHLGCGLSDKPQDYSYRFVDHVDNLVRLVDHLDLDQLTLLGHDWGGAIGLAAAVRRPDRIARLILFNTGAFPPLRVPRRIALCRTPLLGELAVRGANVFARAATWMATARRGQVDPLVAAGMLAPYDNWGNRIAIQRFVDEIPMSSRHPNHAVLVKLEKEIGRFSDRPVMLVWGMRDWCFTPRCLERFESVFPDAEVHRLEEAGHWVIEDVPTRVITCVDSFLESSGCHWPILAK